MIALWVWDQEMFCLFMFCWPDDCPRSISGAFVDTLRITLPEGLPGSSVTWVSDQIAFGR